MINLLFHIILFPSNALLFVVWLYVSLMALVVFPIQWYREGLSDAVKSYVEARKYHWRHIYEDYY